jgi:hypothetical protein
MDNSDVFLYCHSRTRHFALKMRVFPFPHLPWKINSWEETFHAIFVIYLKVRNLCHEHEFETSSIQYSSVIDFVLYFFLNTNA